MNKQSKFKNRLALVFLLTFFLLIIVIIIVPYFMGLSGATGIDRIQSTTLDRLLNSFTGFAGIIVGFYFGANQVSHDNSNSEQ